MLVLSLGDTSCNLVTRRGDIKLTALLQWMSFQSFSTLGSAARRVTLYHLPLPCIRPPPPPFSRHASTRIHLHPTMHSSSRFHTSAFKSAVLSPPTASQSDPDATLLTPLSHDEAPTLKEVLDPALWFPDAEPAPAPPTASEVANAASAMSDSASSNAGGTEGSAEVGGLYYTTSHPQLHPVAPIAEAVAPLPCAYTPPDIAPLLDVDDIKKAMASVIVNEADDEEQRRAAEARKVKVVEVKGLEELLEDVQADEEEAKKGKALVVGT